MRSFALALFASSALLAIGCAAEPSSRDLTGTVHASAGQAITQVIAEEAGNSQGVVLTAAVGADGRFSLSLPTGKRFLVFFGDGAAKVGILRFADGQGGLTSLLPVAAPPAATVGAKAQDAGDDSDEADDADDDIDLGDVDDADGDGEYEPDSDPLDQVDSDGDGDADSEDADDDNDGEDDDLDADDDDNGVDDASEDGDADDDGETDDLDDEADDDSP